MSLGVSTWPPTGAEITLLQSKSSSDDGYKTYIFTQRAVVSGVGEATFVIGGAGVRNVCTCRFDLHAEGIGWVRGHGQAAADALLAAAALS